MADILVANVLDEPLVDTERYTKIQDLNRGAFGFVQLAKDTVTGEEVAIKFIERGPKVTEHVENEIFNLRKLNHFHIVQFRRVFLTKKYLGIVMEYVSQGNLYEYLKELGHGLEEHKARWFFQQLIVAVDYCHRLGIVNRDIKLENTLLCPNPNPSKLQLLKLCDFGYSKDETRQSIANTKVGTLDYYAPEVLVLTRGESYDAKKADVWACGVTLCAMLTRSYPFRRVDDETLNPYTKLNTIMVRIVNADYKLPENCTPECRDLLHQLLQADPSSRCSIHQVLHHPWFVTNLPRGVAEMNENPDLYKNLSRPGVQSVEDIRRVVKEGRCVGSPSGIMLLQERDSDSEWSGIPAVDTVRTPDITSSLLRARSSTSPTEKPRSPSGLDESGQAAPGDHVCRVFHQSSCILTTASQLQTALADIILRAQSKGGNNNVKATNAEISKMHQLAGQLRSNSLNLEALLRALYK